MKPKVINLFDIQSHVFDWLPFSATLIVAIVILFGLQKLLAYRARKNVTGVKVFPQLFQFFLGIIFVIALILNSPLSENTKGQLLSLLGILLTAAIALSSTNFLGNLMGGLMIRTLDKFGPGDFLRIGENLGRVTELGLLHTEIQTADRDLINYPNMHLVSNPIRVIRASGTIISEEVSLGYDINHNDIERSLMKALEKTNLTDPFVHIQALGDFSVIYRASGFLGDVKTIISTKNALRENILDQLHSDRIEIVSPSFMNQRVYDPKTHFIPKKTEEAQTNGALPEEVIFDKADAAESIEAAKERLKNVENELGEIKENKEMDPEEKKLQVQLLERRRDKIIKLIKSKEEDKPKD